MPSPCPPISPSFCWNDPPRPQTPVKFPWIVYGRKPLRVRKHVSTAIICFLITPWVFVGAIMVVRPTWFDSWMRWWRKLQNKWANHSKSASRQAFRNQTASQCELSGYATNQGAGSYCAPRNEGYARGTRKASRELIEKEKEEMAERVGFEPTVGVSLHTLSKRAP